MVKRSSLMTRILTVISCAAVTAFACFSFYIDGLQSHAIDDAVRSSIQQTGRKAADGVAGWLESRMVLTQAAQEIKSLINSSTAEVDNGVRLDEQTGDALRAIGTEIGQINAHMDAIAVSAREQTVGLAEVNTAVSQMEQVTRQNTEMVKDTNAATSMLAQEASRLRQLLSHFRLANSTTLRAAASGLAPTSGAASKTGSRRSAGA